MRYTIKVKGHKCPTLWRWRAPPRRLAGNPQPAIVRTSDDNISPEGIQTRADRDRDGENVAHMNPSRRNRRVLRMRCV